MTEFNSGDRGDLERYLDGGGYTADPVGNYAEAAAILETAKEAGYLYDWAPSVAGGRPMRDPLGDILIDVWPVVDGKPTERGHLFATYVVTFARGLLEGDPRADIKAFRADHQQAGGR